MSSDREEKLLAIREARWLAKTPPDYKSASIASLSTEVKGPVSKWISKNDRRNVVIAGPVGTGKSYLAHALQRHLEVDEGTPCPFWTKARLNDALRHQESSAKVMKEIEEAEYLIVDDIGADRSTEWAEERFLMIMDERWKWHRPTIITTNYPLKRETLNSELGERLVSRLLDGAVGVQLSTEDKRRKSG